MMVICFIGLITLLIIASVVYGRNDNHSEYDIKISHLVIGTVVPTSQT